jgi:purine nucleosidase
VLGITTVAGNVPLSYTSRNARIICELCDRKADMKVFSPAPTGRWCRPLVTAEHVHGKTGLDGPTCSMSRPCRCRRSTPSISSSRRCATSRKAR